MRFIKAESYRRGIISSTLFNVAAKGIGFINSLLIIYIFGSGLETDFYFLVLATVTLITSFVNGIDLLILVPEAMRLRINHGQKAEYSFLNFFIRIYFILGAIISIFIMSAPVLFYSLFSKYSNADLNNQYVMLMLTSVLFPMQLLNSLFVSILASHRYFTVPMLVNVVNSIVSITVLILLRNSLSIKGAVIAMIAGYTVNFIWLIFFFRQKLNWNFFEKSNFPTPTILKNVFLVQLNILPITVRSYVIVFLLSGMGSGIITAYNYGQQFSQIPHMLITTQVMAVAGVKFNELSSQRNEEEMNNLFSVLLKLLYLVIVPIAAVMALTSKEIVIELFKYSNKIQPETIGNISLVLLFMALTLPSMAMDQVMTKLMMARQKIREGVFFGIVAHIAITLFVFLGITFYGLKGFLFAFFFAYNIFLPTLNYFVLKRLTPFIHYLKWIRESLPFIIFNVILFFLLYFGKMYFLSDVNPLAVILLIGFVYTGCILLFNRYFTYYQPLNSVINKYILRR